MLPSISTELPRPANAGQNAVTLDGRRLDLLSGSNKAAQAVWADIRGDVLNAIIEIHADYHSSSPNTQPLTAAAAWKSVRKGSVRVGKNRSLELSAQFTWQSSNDGHRTTIYVKKGAVVGHSLDG